MESIGSTMKSLICVAAILLLSFNQNPSGSEIGFQASPSRIYPFITQTLTVRCVVRKEGAAFSAQPSDGVSHRPTAAVSHNPSAGVSHRPTSGVSHNPSAGVSHRPTAAVSYNPSAGVSHRPTAAVSHNPSAGVSHRPTHGVSHNPTAGVSHNPTAAVSHNPSAGVSHRPTAAVSHNPSAGVSHGLTSGVSHNPSAGVSHRPTHAVSHNPSDGVSHHPSQSVTSRPQTTPASQDTADLKIFSIIISKRDKTTGLLQTVASISTTNPPTANIDQENIKVSGTAASPNAPQQGYLEVSWDYPTEDQSGDYFCDVYGLDTTERPVALFSTVHVDE
jgi:hypothetical protein